LNDSDPRYSFTCPNCAGSFSISLGKIPPVQARFSCPKCGKAMDFPSRDEARVYISLQGGGGEAAETPAATARTAPVEAEPAPTPRPAAPAAAPLRPAAPPAPRAPSPPLESLGDSTATSQKSYRVEKKGFENDVYDRRSMRNIIRSGGLNENDSVAIDSDPARRAGEIPELKSLFDLRKNSRVQPPSVCGKHTDRVAHYVCAGTDRPLCEECAAEKKYGGASVRVCEHCGGTVNELPVAEEP
jgi:predicted Zn finger-like uncharacterized protein